MLLAAVFTFVLSGGFSGHAQAGSLSDGNKVKVNPANPASLYYIIIDKQKQAMTVYTKGSTGKYDKLVRQMKCSTGREASFTPVGTFRMQAKHRWLNSGDTKEQYASRVVGSILIHSTLFTDGNIRKLVRDSYNRLGRPASAGCIRLCVRDAKWIYSNCPVGTTVKIVTSGGPAITNLETLPPLKAGMTYDPTDTAITR